MYEQGKNLPTDILKRQTPIQNLFKDDVEIEQRLVSRTAAEDDETRHSPYYTRPSEEHQEQNETEKPYGVETSERPVYWCRRLPPLHIMKSAQYDDDEAHKRRGMNRKIAIEMKDRNFDGKYPVSIITLFMIWIQLVTPAVFTKKLLFGFLSTS